MNTFMDWLEKRKKIAVEKAEYSAQCQHLALLAASGCDLRKSYRLATQKDLFFISENGASTSISYDEFRKRNGQLNEVTDLGGIITFSSKVTHKTEEGERVPVSSMKDKLIAKVQSFINRWTAKSKVDEAVKSINKSIGYSLGNFFSGRYVDANNNVFNEKSASLDILGITSEQLYSIAKSLCEEFDQNSCMIYDRNKNKYYEYNNKKEGVFSNDKPWKLDPNEV